MAADFRVPEVVGGYPVGGPAALVQKGEESVLATYLVGIAPVEEAE